MRNPLRLEVLTGVPAAERARHHWQRSLFGEILDWMLAPLLILWPLSMAIEYYVSSSIANAAYDHELSVRVRTLADQIRYRDGTITIDLSPGAIALLRDDPGERALSEAEALGSTFTHRGYYQIRGLSDEIIAGDTVLPSVDFTPDLFIGRVYFKVHEIQGFELRAAYTFAQVQGFTGALLVQVAETVAKRRHLASEIIGKVLAAQLIFVPVAILLVWFGLSKGVAPLNALRDKIRVRRSVDLSPIDTTDVPEEIKPFIDSINDLIERLSQTLRSQRRFIADAAHQMRTPLAGLKTQAELAVRQSRREDVEHAVRQIAQSADRASHMVNQLLALARAESGVHLRASELDLNQFVRDVTLEWVDRALAKGIDLGFEHAERPARVPGHPHLLREMLNNLIDNAVRYTPPGGRVTTRVVSDLHPTLEVEDTGIGIDEGEQQLVFDRFYRVLGTDTDGSGLGLAIAKEIAEVHAAQIRIRSNPQERGIIVSVSFRSATGPHEHARSGADPASRSAAPASSVAADRGDGLPIP